MAKILFAAGIEEVSGALSKINTKSKHRYDENMLLATHRKAATMSLYCQRAYYRKINKLPWQSTTNPLSEDTTILRQKFAAKVRAISERKQNLTYVARDIAAFKEWRAASDARKNTTMNSWYWLAAAKYQSESSPYSVEFPTDIVVD